MVILVEIGEKAPDFSLVDMNMKAHMLSNYRCKNLVSAFFLGVFTSTCKKEMCILRDDIAKFEKLQAQVLGISVNDPFSNKVFHEENMLNFPLLCDYNREVITAYSVVKTDFAGLKGYSAAKRSFFVVDKARVVRYKWVSEDPRVEPNYKEIAKILGKS